MDRDFRTQPLDAASFRDLEEAGLRLALVDTGDADALDAWTRADFRGFHGSHPNAETLTEARASFGDLRTTAVYDDAAPTAEPVGTTSSWVTPLTVPGCSSVDAWAISSVTVAPTHRRRGIARALLGAELRTAHTLGVPLAILTVSESVIYGRWGFGPATFTTDWSVDTKRVRWAGGETPGRLAFTDPEAYRDTARTVLDAAMSRRPGEIALTPYLAARLVGPLAATPDAERYRLVRYDSPAGEPEGFVSYVVKGTDDFAKHTVTVNYLAAATGDALRALWRFLLELDLVAEVRAGTRGVDEPLHALVSDVRGARVTGLQDHLWVRILDLPAALSGRAYEQDGELVLEVTDELGFADGRFRLAVEGGRAAVTPTTDAPDVTLPIASLGSVYLGHDIARSLALAGRISGDAAALDRLFRTAIPPRLSTWF